MKNLIVSARVFAFIMFLFIPSLVVLLFAGFVLRDTFWFLLLGLTTLLANGLMLFVKPISSLILRQLNVISGRPGQHAEQ